MFHVEHFLLFSKTKIILFLRTFAQNQCFPQQNCDICLTPIVIYANIGTGSQKQENTMTARKLIVLSTLVILGLYIAPMLAYAQAFAASLAR